jgi:hypothetical protein
MHNSCCYNNVAESRILVPFREKTAWVETLQVGRLRFSPEHKPDGGTGHGRNCEPRRWAECVSQEGRTQIDDARETGSQPVCLLLPLSGTCYNWCA